VTPMNRRRQRLALARNPFAGAPADGVKNCVVAGRSDL
jgi:hypothetical protein